MSGYFQDLFSNLRNSIYHEAFEHFFVKRDIFLGGDLVIKSICALTHDTFDLFLPYINRHQVELHGSINGPEKSIAILPSFTLDFIRIFTKRNLSVTNEHELI